MFYQTFYSPQVKRCTILIYKNGIYELPDEFPNNLRLFCMKTKVSLKFLEDDCSPNIA